MCANVDMLFFSVSKMTHKIDFCEIFACTGGNCRKDHKFTTSYILVSNRCSILLIQGFCLPESSSGNYRLISGQNFRKVGPGPISNYYWIRCIDKVVALFSAKV